jgi:hypothetical protein
MASRRWRVMLLMLVLATASLVTTKVAWASGTCTPSSRQVAFYYNVSGGNCDSNDFMGYGSATLRADAPGCCNPQSQDYFNSYYLKNRTGLPDTVLKWLDTKYNYSEKVTPSFSTSASSKYHTNALWGKISPSQAGNPSGYSRAS